jgi:hypothetical protein
MSDSEKEQPQAIPQKPPEGTSLVVIRTKDGGTREMLRNEKGTFVKKPRPLIPTIEFTRRERKTLNSVRSDKEGLTEYMVAFMNMLRIAQNEDSDPKAMMAAVKAFEILRLSALGKPAPSEQELDKLTNQPVKVIIVQAPQLMHPDVVDADKVRAAKTQPSFIDAEVIKQD